MAYGNQVKTDALSTVYDDEVYPLGTTFMQQADEVAAAAHTSSLSDATNPDNLLGLQGDRTWVFVKAGATVTQYGCCVINAAGTSFVVKDCDADDDEVFDIVGVSQNGIATGKYGWIVKTGEVVVLATSVAAGAFLTTDGSTGANGSVDESTTAGDLIGRALTATATLPSGSTLAGHAGAYISCP
tara:strand:- start:5 stop:559 length:555 start_codon:yes stop_codon:yes gene_type:complete